MLDRFIAAVSANDLPAVRVMLAERPELARMSADNLGPLHHAVLQHATEMVRLLLQHGADPHDGVYPHRDATSTLTIALERGYDDVVAAIRDEEQRRRSARTGLERAPDVDGLIRAIAGGDLGKATSMMEADPALVRSCHAQSGRTPAHLAAHYLNAPLVTWLLAHGASADATDASGRTPLDVAAQRSSDATTAEMRDIASTLVAHGAVMTPSGAAALGDAVWLRQQHAAGTLSNPIRDDGGLLRIAVSNNRPDVLTLLLDSGLDPDERFRVGGDEEEVAFSWGMPLWHCAGSAKYEMAEMLLRHGADPNAKVMASGDPVFQAYSQSDGAMIDLLSRHGGVPAATTAGLYRQTTLARRMLAGEAPCRLDGVGGDTLAEQLLWGAACGGDSEVVALALDQVDWPRDDARWFTVLEQPLRLWTHGSSGADWDRSTYLTCFRLILDRAEPNLRGRPQDKQQFGLTILHSIAGSREHLSAEDRLAFATAALDAGARLDLRDHFLKSTPLGWACRWGRPELVRLLVARGADTVEPDAEGWATPQAWAQKKKGHDHVLALLRG